MRTQTRRGGRKKWGRFKSFNVGRVLVLNNPPAAAAAVSSHLCVTVYINLPVPLQIGPCSLLSILRPLAILHDGTCTSLRSVCNVVPMRPKFDSARGRSVPACSPHFPLEVQSAFPSRPFLFPLPLPPSYIPTRSSPSYRRQPSSVALTLGLPPTSLALAHSPPAPPLAICPAHTGRPTTYLPRVPSSPSISSLFPLLLLSPHPNSSPFTPHNPRTSPSTVRRVVYTCTVRKHAWDAGPVPGPACRYSPPSDPSTSSIDGCATFISSLKTSSSPRPPHIRGWGGREAVGVYWGGRPDDGWVASVWGALCGSEVRASVVVVRASVQTGNYDSRFGRLGRHRAAANWPITSRRVATNVASALRYRVINSIEHLLSHPKPRAAWRAREVSTSNGSRGRGVRKSSRWRNAANVSGVCVPILFDYIVVSQARLHSVSCPVSRTRDTALLARQRTDASCSAARRVIHLDFNKCSSRRPPRLYTPFNPGLESFVFVFPLATLSRWSTTRPRGARPRLTSPSRIVPIASSTRVSCSELITTLACCEWSSDIS